MQIVGFPSINNSTGVYYSQPPLNLNTRLSLYLFSDLGTYDINGRWLPKKPAWTLMPYSSRWTTSATMKGRWDGVVIFPVPPQATLTSGTHTLRFECSGILGFIWPNIYVTEATFIVKPASSATISTRDLTLPSPITISPNPTNDVCMLALPENELRRVRLTNSLGTAVATLSEATGATALDVSGLAAGVYFVEVESRTTRRRWVQKMVKY
jgi:hypothetical protein